MKPNDIKVRRQWTMKPIERIHQKGKKNGYDRSRQNRDWKSDID
jgi:hypothetical protein